MKKIISFILAFVMIIGTVANAAPGDIIHTGSKKVYKPGSDELIQAIINGADIKQFYREVEADAGGDRQFVNIVKEEEEELKLLKDLVESKGIQSAESLAQYLKDHPDVAKEVENIGKSIATSIDEIPNGGSLEEYFKDSKAPILKTPDNYSTPVPGSTDGTTQIINLTLPKGGNSWVYKIGTEDFKDLELDKVILNTTEYKSGRNIPVEEDKYLFLGAVDSAGKLKAYASIQILDTMMKKPRVEATKDDTISSTFAAGTNYSGATKVTILPKGTWKLSVLDIMPDKVYTDSKFNDAKDYKDGIELIVASHSELDSGLDGFKKYIIVYSETDGKIETYNIFDLDKSNVSGIFKAPTLKTPDNYSTPVPGSSAGTTRIVELKLDDIKGANKWMYAIVEDTTAVPNLDRVYTNSQPYIQGQDIKINPEDNLMILATDDAGKVRAYTMVTVIGNMIRNTLATELRETTNYSKPEKGTDAGSTKFGFLNTDGVTKWIYRVDDTVIDAPELGSTTTGAGITLTVDVSGDITVEEIQTKLKVDNFRKYMTIYGLDSENKVKVYKRFTMDDTNVRMPIAETLEDSKHYFGHGKGNSANSTKFSNLITAGITGNTGTNLKFKYKIIDKADIRAIEFNEKIPDTFDLKANVDISVSVGRHLLILVVDGSNKTKAYTTIELKFENVKAGNATLLQPTTNYVGPVPGSGNNSTQFTFLNLPASTSKFVYKLGDTTFGPQEAGSIVIGTTIEAKKDIDKVATNKFLLLLAVATEDEKDKVVAYREFKLLEDQVKGSTGIKLVDGAYKLEKGDTPSTTKLKLQALGLENPSSIRWRYKLVHDDYAYIPYFNEILGGTTVYSVNNTFIGPDIPVVKKAEDDYGKILILATDTSGRTKAYAYVDVKSNDVKEHVPEIEESPGKKLDLGVGSAIDSVKFKNLPELTGGNKYKYLISNTKPTTPATGDSLPTGVVNYDKLDSKYKDITVHIGKHLSLYEVDGNSKIVKFSTFEITEVTQATAELKLVSPEDLVEGNIVNGGAKLTITLTGATWANLMTNKSARDKLFNSFKADKESSEWSKVVAALVADGEGAIGIAGEVLTILLPETLNYDITKNQIISLTIAYEAIEGALNPIKVDNTIIIKPTVKATISGDVVSGIVREADLIAGGKTIIVELADGNWVSDVSSIINGFSSNIENDSNWSKIVTEVVSNGTITRNSGTKVTIKLPPVPGISFDTTPSAISLEIPSTLIQGATGNVVASPKFTLYPNKIQVAGNPVVDKNQITLEAPDYRAIVKDKDTWSINVTTGTLENINNNSVVITGLPKGFVANVSKVSGQNQIQIKLTGTASATLASDTIVKVKIKGSAVTEPNAEDSNEMDLKLVRGGSILDDLKRITVDVLNKKLKDGVQDISLDNIQYSLNSTDGINGNDWTKAKGSHPITFKSGKVYVRDENNPKVFYLVTTLTTPKAPTGISVSKVDYIDGMNVTLNLPDNDGSKYDYSINGGADWKEMDSTSKVELGKNPDLRIRLRATVDSLPSLATSKINVLDLSGVEMNVGEGKLTGTTAQMQYSLNGGVTYPGTAKLTETTSIPFVAGATVMIRDGSSQGNTRELGQIFIKPVPDLNLITFNILGDGISGGTITPADATLQYRFVNSDPWNDLGDGTKIEFKPGQLQFRTKGDKSHLPSVSDMDEKFKIDNPKSGPELRIDDLKKDILYWDNDSKIWVPLKDAPSNLLQYKIDGDWKNSEIWTSESFEYDNVLVSVRYKATSHTLPSLLTTANFTGNLKFDNVELNVVEGKIDGTTIAMQYSTNSTNGLDGTWNDVKKDQPPIEFIQGTKVYIREKAKPFNNQKLSDGIGVEDIILDKVENISYSIVEGSVTNGTLKILEYRLGNEKWKILNRAGDKPFSIYGITFTPGTLQFRTRGTKTTLPSLSITKDIKAKASAPELKYDDVKYTIEKIGSSDGSNYEYNINGGSWIPGTVNSVFEGGDVVRVRLKAKDDTLPSNEQPITFKKNLDLTNVILNAGKSQLENTSNLMEYSLDSTNGEDGLWLSITKNPTPLKLNEGSKVYIREKAKPRNKREVNINPIGQEKASDINTTILGKISYNILQGTISITSNDNVNDQKIVDKLQYRINDYKPDTKWIDIDYVRLDGNTSKVLVYNVNFVQGDLEFRLKGNELTLPSDGVFKSRIKASISAPNVSKGFNQTKYRNTIAPTTNLSKLEYSLAGKNGPWIDGKHLEEEDLVGTVYIRTKAIDILLPSLVKELIFTPVLNLKTVNLSTHVKPFELNGVTAQMEYNINEVEWKPCKPDEYGNSQLLKKNGDPLDDLTPVRGIWLRDALQNSNQIQIYSVPQP